MTFAWYAHLKNLSHKPWIVAALVSWGIALFEYLLQVPANRIGHTQMERRPAEDPAGGDHARGLRAVLGPLHEGAAQAELPLGGALPRGGGVLHVPGLSCAHRTTSRCHDENPTGIGPRRSDPSNGAKLTESGSAPSGEPESSVRTASTTCHEPSRWNAGAGAVGRRAPCGRRPPGSRTAGSALSAGTRPSPKRAGDEERRGRAAAAGQGTGGPAARASG